MGRLKTHRFLLSVFLGHRMYLVTLECTWMLSLFLATNGYLIRKIAVCCKYVCYHQNTWPMEPALYRLHILWCIQLALKWCDPCCLFWDHQKIICMSRTFACMSCERVMRYFTWCFVVCVCLWFCCFFVCVWNLGLGVDARPSINRSVCWCGF